MSRDLTPIYDVMPQEANQPAVVETTTQPAPNMPIAPNAIAPNNMVAPPNGGPLPPGLSLPPLGNVVPGQMPSLPNIPTTNELSKKVTEAQKESGPPVAPSALDQLDLKKHMHDFIESEHFWPTVGTGALALAGYGGAKAYQAYKKSKSVEERNIAKIEPSFGGGGTETITAAAEREMRDPIIKDGVRGGELKSFLNTDKLPTGMDLDLAVKSYLSTMGRTSIPANVDLGSVMNFKPGEPVMGSTQATPDNVTGVDYSKPAYLRNKRTAPETTPIVNPVVEATALNIPTFGEPKNAEQGGVEIPANSDPVHLKEEQDLSSAAQNSKERAQTIDTAQTEVKDAIRPRTIADIQARPEINPSLREHLARQEALLASNEKYHKTLAREYESGAKIGAGQVFVPGLGNMDNSMYNTLGAEGRREAMEALKGGKAFGQVTLPGQGFNEQFSKNLEDYSKHLSETIPVDLTTRKSRIAEGLAHTDNYKKLGKVMRIAGVTGLGMAISDLVNAKSIPEAVLRAGDIATDYLPFVGQAKQGLSPGEVGAPTLTPQILEAQRQATLLGSPYRKSKGIKPPER
jgi:hypothetical protein